MAPIVKRTWALAGETPKIIHKTRSHTKISAIGAIAVRHTGRRPRMMFRLLARFGAIRPMISVHSDRPFRSKPTGDFGAIRPVDC